jgi:uncharacterized membrane protein
MPFDYLAWTLRLLHILAVITAVGGTIFVRCALVPEADHLPDGERRTLHERIRTRWSRYVQLSILFLLVTGLINFIMFVRAAKTWPDDWRDTYYSTYQMLFGIKFVLALGIFALSSILVGRSAGTQKIRDNPRPWLNLNLALALAVVMISGAMRLTHVGPTPPAAGQPVQQSTGG